MFAAAPMAAPPMLTGAAKAEIARITGVVH